MAKESGIKELKKQLSQGIVNGIYLLYGEEVFIKDSYVKKIIDLIDDGGMPDFNKLVFDGEKADISEIDDAIESFPMMCEKKLILIKDSRIFSKAKEEIKQYWLNRLDSIPDYVVLVFDEKEVDKRSALLKKVAKFGACFEFEVMNENDTVTWVERQVLNSGKKIAKDVAQYFVSVCDDGLSNVKNELDKLLNYCEKQIGKSDVDKIVSKAVGVKVFELTNHIMSKNPDGAMKILNDLKTVKEPAFKLLYLLSGTFDKMLRCSLLLAEGNSYSDIAAKIKVAPFIAQKYANSARGFGENYLVDRIIAAANIDLQIKNGQIGDWEALELYVIDSCEKIN